MRYVLGVDGGNTKTMAAVARIDGRIVGVGRGGCGDIYGQGEALALASTRTAVEDSLTLAGLAPSDLAAGVFSMAGADWPEDFAFLAEQMQACGYGRRIIVHNDAIGALRAGSSTGVGVSVVCGTGGATGARGTDGALWHSSFWQNVGGAQQLGERALRAVVDAEIGLAPPTALTGRMLECFGQASVEALLHALTARHLQPAPPAAELAPLLLAAADAGDPVAAGIVVEHGEAFGAMAVVAAEQVRLSGAFPLVLAGGVLRSPVRLLSETIVARVRQRYPEVQPVAARYEPVIGALLLAFEACGVPVNAGRLAQIEATLPPASLFATVGR